MILQSSLWQKEGWTLFTTSARRILLRTNALYYCSITTTHTRRILLRTNALYYCSLRCGRRRTADARTQHLYYCSLLISLLLQEEMQRTEVQLKELHARGEELVAEAAAHQESAALP